MYAFAGATCVRYAEAKEGTAIYNQLKRQAQPACGTPRQSSLLSANYFDDFRRNLRAVRHES